MQIGGSQVTVGIYDGPDFQMDWKLPESDRHAGRHDPMRSGAFGDRQASIVGTLSSVPVILRVCDG